MRIKELLGEVSATDMANSLVNLVNPKLPTQQQPTTKPSTSPVTKPITAVAQPVPVVASKTPTEPAEFKPLDHKSGLTAMATKVFPNPSDLANFLGQCAHETANWAKASEGFSYSTAQRIYAVFTSKFSTPQEAARYINNPVALANRALAGKNGNGDEASGDGWRYRGRGFIHITGRSNYAAAGVAVHPENPNIYIDNPALVSSNAKESAKVAIWYFKTKVGAGKTSAQATKKVSGSNIGAKQRQQYTQAELKNINQQSRAQQAAKPLKTSQK